MELQKIQNCFYHNTQRKFLCEKCGKNLCHDCVKVVKDPEFRDISYCYPCYYQYLKNKEADMFKFIPILCVCLFGSIFLFINGNILEGILLFIILFGVPLFLLIFLRPIQLEKARKVAMKYESGSYQLDENIKKK
ncbi:hypothetical protein [Candidatus Lokiarchaeum ossiferum]|uniref:hypothetical protein n=1 Tax=Candidatus Lokiarchaeum ossiferum TaxID=2951803 RepID=UPI00352C7EEF